MQFGYLDVGKSFLQQPLLKCLLYLVFSVYDKKRFYFGRVLAGEELAEVVIIPVCAHAADTADFRVDFVEDAEDMDFLGSCHQPAAKRAWFAIANQEDGIAAVFNVVADMVFDASCIGHTAGRD